MQTREMLTLMSTLIQFRVLGLIPRVTAKELQCQNLLQQLIIRIESLLKN